MGTSSSSKGPGSGVPMTPPWADPATGPADGDGDDASGGGAEEGDGKDASKPKDSSVLAPVARFGGARTNLNQFARSGDTQAMRRGVGHYVAKGYGGSKTASSRFGGTASTAARLSGVLSALSTGGSASTDTAGLDRTELSGRTAEQVIDAIVQAVRPVDGTQDAESSREAMRDALCDVLDAQPEADLLELSDSARELVIERFVGHDVFRRIVLDIGHAMQDAAPNAATFYSRLEQVKEYVQQTVAASFRRLSEADQSLSGGNVAAISRAAIRETMEVFEGWVE
ncbi:Qat anti-phage system associated protein QatB [Hyphomonas sp.]|uniref:Qat anti-phage system associated protein QatB n=2 Tax=Hyphomonas TaxID=85 RepID=UPI00351874FB